METFLPHGPALLPPCSTSTKPLPDPSMNASISAGMTRRTFLGRSAAGIGSMALGSLLQNDLVAGSRGVLSSLHHPAKAKRVIFLFMAGGPSHIDLFDPKPKLNELDGKPIPDELLKDHQQFALIRGTPNFRRSPLRIQATRSIWHCHIRTPAASRQSRRRVDCDSFDAYRHQRARSWSQFHEQRNAG